MRILFVGNEDNVNLRICMWLRKSGIEADLLLTGDEQSPRGQLKYFDPQLEKNVPSWIGRHEITDPIKFANGRNQFSANLQNEYCAIVTAGLSSLVASKAINLPQVHIAVGSEIGVWPLYRRALRVPVKARRLSAGWLKAKLTYVKYTTAVRAALEDVNVIMESFNWNHAVISELGYERKVLHLAPAEDVQETTSCLDEGCIAALEQKFGKYDRVFGWFSRLNFLDKNSNSYKGADLFLSALLEIKDEILSGRVGVVIGRHGSHAEEFERAARQSEICERIHWIDHLPRSELLHYLSISRLVLFSEFGEVNDGLSGIGRDAVSVGTVIVSGCKPEVIKRQYGRPAPILRATTNLEIAARMKELIEMPSAQFETLKRETRAFGLQCVDYRQRFLPAFLKGIERAIVDFEGR